MVDTNSKSKIEAPRSGLFMESTPDAFATELPGDGHQLVRRVMIAAGSAALVFGLTQLLFEILAAV